MGPRIQRLIASIDARLIKSLVVLDHRTEQPVMRNGIPARIAIFRPINLFVSRGPEGLEEFVLHILAFSRGVSDDYRFISMQGILALGWRHGEITIEVCPRNVVYLVRVGLFSFQIGSETSSWRVEIGG